MTFKNYFFGIWAGCFIGQFSVLPFAHLISVAVGGKIIEYTPFFLSIVGLQGIIGYGLVAFFGLKFSQKMGIHLLLLNEKSRFIEDFLKPGMVAGIICASLLITGNMLMQAEQLNVPLNPFYGLLALIYAGFNEEVILRLFLLSGIALLLKKIFKNMSASTIMWVSIAVTSLMFGLAHLPIALRGVTATPIFVVRIMILNGVGGIIFGWLFWRKGLETAMLAHIVADFFLYVAIPLIRGY